MAAHLDEAALDRFLAHGGECPVDRATVRHLLAGCPDCARSVAHLLMPEAAASRQTAEYGAAFARAAAGAAQRYEQAHQSTAELERLFARLERQPPGRRLTLVKSSPRFRTPGFVGRLLRACRERLSSDVREAVRFGQLAVEAAGGMDPDLYGESLVEDLRCRALSELANAERRASQFGVAGERLEEARSLLSRGSGDPLARALVEEYEAYLLSDQGRHEEALERLRTAQRCYRALKDSHRCGTNLVRQAQVLEDAGEPQAAIQLLFQAAALVDCEREPRWRLAIYHNLVVCHADAGQVEAALEFLADARPLYSRLGQPADRLRLRWTEGRLELQRGRPRQAELCLREAAEGFAEMGLAFEAAEVSLELALVYQESGKHSELRRLAEGLVPIFESQGLHREALAAFACLQRAVAAETVSAELLRRLMGFLADLKADPARVFEAARIGAD